MKKSIYLLDLTHESALGLGSDMMPLQLGLIGAHCLNEYKDQIDVQIFKFHHDLEAAVRKNPPFIIGASNYLWNIDFDYQAACAIKAKYPDTVVVFGGPNYPDNYDEQVDWLKQYPGIDFYIYKDGEIPFTRLVGALLQDPNLSKVKQAKLPSCHAFVNGVPYFGETEKRQMDLSATPSPYTTGLMDKFFEERLLPTIQTNRGCPFTCTFCTEGSMYYNKIGKMSLERKKADIEYIVSHLKHTKTLRITDSNFGMFPEDVEFCTYLGEVQKKTGYPEYVACSTGKNQKERILKCNELLGGVLRFTASVQSLSPDVLKNIKRTNISIDQLMALSDQVSDGDTHSYSEIILGLPGDSLQREKESMDGLTKAGISNITQHQLAIIYGTEMGGNETRDKFEMKTKFRPIQRCLGAYTFLDTAITPIEIEEICIATNSMSFDDYLEARRLYLTIGLFYNDRIFGEINALLRLLRVSTWGWLQFLHEEIKTAPANVKLRHHYDEFIRETKGELWDSPEQLVKDVGANIAKYSSGEIGGNLIYKYRAGAIVNQFPELQQAAYRSLRGYLTKLGIKCEELVQELEQFSQFQKMDLLSLDFEKTQQFHYDIVRMIQDASLARENKTVEDIHYSTPLRFAHAPKQKETILRQLNFYGKDIGGMTMLISRFPLKRLYRTVEKIPTNLGLSAA